MMNWFSESATAKGTVKFRLLHHVTVQDHCAMFIRHVSSNGSSLQTSEAVNFVNSSSLCRAKSNHLVR